MMMLPSPLFCDDGGLPCSEMVACRQCSAVSLVGCDHVMVGINAVFVDQVVAQGLELGVRNSRIEVGADDIYEIFNFQDKSPQYFVIEQVDGVFCELNRVVLESDGIDALFQ